MQSWGKLLILEPGRPSRSLLLKTTRICAGRWPDCEIFLNDPEISKQHFKLTLVDGKYPFIEDTSSNGTIVNGKSIADHHFIFYNTVEPTKLGARDSQILKNHYYIFETQDLGAGAHATVKLAINMETGERLACKVMSKCDFKTSNADVGLDSKSIAREIEILQRLSHPNIVSIRDVVDTSKYVCIFLERILGGELFDYIQRGEGVEETQSKFIFFQILIAMDHLHAKNITHRDLKPENILMETPHAFSRVVVTDFGLAKMARAGSGIQRMNTKCGTVNYLAPEVMMQSSPPTATTDADSSGYGMNVDCWSLGVILFVMLSGDFPFGTDEDCGVKKFFEHVCNSELEFDKEIWGHISHNAIDLVKQLLKVDSAERCSIQGALDHPWIASKRDSLDKLYVKMIRKSGWNRKGVPL